MFGFLKEFSMSAVKLLLSCLLFREVHALSGNFWHITDLHWDRTYELTNTPDLVCASSGKRPAANAGKFGDYVCDSPWHLINSSVYAMKDILPDPDFIVWTGDDTPHVPNEDLGEEAVLDIISNLTDIIKQVFPYTKVYSALGNHDYHPKSQLPAGPNYIYNQTAEMWQGWLEPESRETFKKDSPISTMFLSPGVTPWKTTLPGVVDGANNPGIRVFEYDTQTLLVKDVVTYYLNLTRANVVRGRWEKEYRLTESFRVPDASPASMHQVLERIASSHCYLQKYYEFNSVSYDLTECDGDCRLDHVCAAREVDFEKYNDCVAGGAAAVYGGLLSVLSVAVSLVLAR